MRRQVLVVDDEPAILRAVRAGLMARDFEVLTATTGREALDILTTRLPEVVVLDLGLPDLDGVEICRAVRAWSQVPIIVLSAEASEHRKVLALDEGADDYVTKPFSMPELLARIRVALRRRDREAASTEESVLQVGNVEVDLVHHEVRVAGERIDLTPKEFAMLHALARDPGRVLTHRSLLHEVWGPDYDAETHYLRVYASQIRKKLGAGSTALLLAEPGVGYRLVTDDAM